MARDAIHHLLWFAGEHMSTPAAALACTPHPRSMYVDQRVQSLSMSTSPSNQRTWCTASLAIPSYTLGKPVIPYANDLVNIFIMSKRTIMVSRSQSTSTFPGNLYRTLWWEVWGSVLALTSEGNNLKWKSILGSALCNQMAYTMFSISYKWCTCVWLPRDCTSFKWTVAHTII